MSPSSSCRDRRARLGDARRLGRRRCCWRCLGVRVAAAAGTASPPRRGPFEKLSQYGLFAGDPAAQQPADGVIPYDLNSALFSDYAEKFRFIKLPPGTHATYRDDDAFEFPVGTVIAKTFAYPARRARPVARAAG